MSRIRELLCCALTLCAAACGPELQPGEFGVFRYAGNVRGTPPLDLLAAISDREGNDYVLFGGLKRPEVQLFIGYRGGVWDGGCAATQSTIFGSMAPSFGAHGFVGRAQDQAWYWSGGALVGASAFSGGCEQILKYDPNSAAQLAFQAVIPFVRETPSKTTLVAWVQSPTDPRPFVVQVDLNSSVFRSVAELGPSTIGKVKVLGVGANPDDGEGVVVMKYELGTETRVEARFYDADANETGRVALSGLPNIAELGEYDILGYLQPSGDGLWVGLDVKGKLLLLDHSSGKRSDVSAFKPVGVHQWDKQLFLVGTSASGPMVASIDAKGNVGGAQRWTSSGAAVGSLGSAVEVVDDRTLPSRKATWKNPRTAMGDYPFLHSTSLHRYSDGVTLWLIAGPSFQAGGENQTAIAVAPAGIAYP